MVWKLDIAGAGLRRQVKDASHGSRIATRSSPSSLWMSASWIVHFGVCREASSFRLLAPLLLFVLASVLRLSFCGLLLLLLHVPAASPRLGDRRLSLCSAWRSLTTAVSLAVLGLVGANPS